MVMAQFKIGVISDSFRLPVREGVAKVKDVGAQGMQIYAVAGDMAPENMDAAARADFKAYVAELGLEISALCGDLGGHGFQVAKDNIEKVKRSKEIVDLAVDLGTKVVTTHIGVVPADTSSETYQVMVAACRELGEYAAERGICFAIETGPEKATHLKEFLDTVGSKGIGVNLDPANLVMVVADDPVAAVHILKDYIVHTHAKDGVQHQPCNPEEVYCAFADGGFEELLERTGSLFEELPLGDGDVDWDGYLAALAEIGFNGYLTIEREVGADPEVDIRAAVSFLQERIA
jgi:sugar phosphate isomerase/epimerase